MKQFFFFFLLLLIQKTRAENNLFHPLLQQFSKIIEKFEGNRYPLPEISKQKKEINFFKEDVRGHPAVNTSSGKIIGASYSESHAFYSIPYGKAPIGELR